jgi:pyruvate dehydrogenase E2 component (dihydrolipoamide acetyltransferase)
MTTFNLPDLGEGLAEAEIVRWHVNVGDVVTVDQPMLAVETAKAVVEVPAPFSGVVKTLHGQPGDVIATGAPLVDFESANGASPGRGTVTTPTASSASAVGTDLTPTASSSRATASRTPAASAPAAHVFSDSGTVVGNMPTSDAELVETAHAGGNSNRLNGGTTSSAAGRLRAAPAARALAKRLRVDLTGLKGSGRGGVIIVDDVITRSGIPASGPKTRTPPFPGGEKLRGLRRAMSQSMSLARDNVMNCTLFDDADLHHWREGQDITTRVLRAIAVGCQAEPALNAWYDGDTQTRRVLTRVDVGMAVDTGDGLIVPVIRDVGSRTAAE